MWGASVDDRKRVWTSTLPRFDGPPLCLFRPTVSSRQIGVPTRMTPEKLGEPAMSISCRIVRIYVPRPRLGSKGSFPSIKSMGSIDLRLMRRQGSKINLLST